MHLDIFSLCLSMLDMILFLLYLYMCIISNQSLVHLSELLATNFRKLLYVFYVL